MTRAAIAADVDRGLAIRRELAALKCELDEIQDRLKAAGLTGEHLDLKDEDREGRRYLARGTTSLVPIIFTADILIGSFIDGSPNHDKIRDAAHEHLSSFFCPVKKWQNLYDDGKKFRGRAVELLSGFAPRFISACTAVDKLGIKKSDIKIQWDREEKL